MILINVLRQGAPSTPVHLKISAHLQPLIAALPSLQWPDNITISYFDIGINKGILRLFTNKDLIVFATLKELFALKKITKSFDSIYVEQPNRAWLLQLLFYPKRFIPIVKAANVYDSYSKFFSLPISNKDLDERVDQPISNITAKRVLLFPDSRKASKQMPASLVCTLLQNNPQILEARLGEAGGKGEADNHTIYYSNFTTLIALIKSADYIISTDSLPVHLAFYLGVPHYILYAKKVNQNWLTPYAKKLASYGIFDAHDNLTAMLKGVTAV
jgi:ADP-heptose:LPS heptosyltransferase